MSKISRNDLVSLFMEANANFISKNEYNIEKNVSERNLCALLGYELSLLLIKNSLKKYSCDVEYNRDGVEPKKLFLLTGGHVKNIVCDLIVHQRGKGNNLIALEMKKKPYKKSEYDNDIRRLELLTKKDLKYSFGSESKASQTFMYELGIMYVLDTIKKEITIEFLCDGKHIYSLTKTVGELKAYGKNNKIAI